MSQHANKELFRRYVDIWETGNLDKLASVIHDSYVGHASWGDRDREDLRQRVAAFREKYPNVRFTIHDQLVEGDRVASRLTAAATADGGEEVVLYGLNISRIADGRVIEEWMAWEIQPAKPSAS